ncbi:hypothetical protein LX36DRAFT_724880 [Colletotrichum falcatum]|nr:hypothetical protein LX36DRAFT_724880 [Colletotrichum falcatum]
MPSKQQHHNLDGLEGFVPYENQDGRKATLYNRPWHIAKVAIRGCNIAFSTIIISIALHMLLIDALPASVVLLFEAIPGAVAIFWDVSELITICARGGRKGIHPGAHVGLHLIFWMYFTTIAVIMTLLRGYSSDWPFATEEHAALAFTYLLTLNHFILFVRACVETNKRNTGAPIYMVPAGTKAPQQGHGAHHEKGQMAGASVPIETTAPTGSDGTYYGPESRA